MTNSLSKFHTKKQLYQNLNKLFDHPGISLFRSRELGEVNEYLNRHPQKINMRILDLGCGNGKISNMLFNEINVGLDVVSEEAERAYNLPAYKSIVIADAREMPFKDDSFDIVFSNSVIEHIWGINNVLTEVSRILRNQGLFIFTVPSHKFSACLYFTTLFSKIGLSFLGHIYSKARNWQLNHFNVFDDLKWKRLLKEVSLNVIYKKYYLSHKEIYEWDKMCFLLRITKQLPFVHQKLKSSFYKKVQHLLAKEQNLTIGGGLLVVAKKHKYKTKDTKT